LVPLPPPSSLLSIDQEVDTGFYLVKAIYRPQQQMDFKNNYYKIVTAQNIKEGSM